MVARLAALGEAAHAALPVPGGGRRRSTAGPACRSCATWRWPIRATRARCAQDDEFLFGPDLLAAPVLAPGARRGARSTCRAGAGSTCGARRATASATAGCRCGARGCCAAGARSSLPAPLDELPLLARAGTLLALLPPDVDTLAAYGDRAPAVSLHERQRAARAAGVPARPLVGRAGGRRRRCVSRERPGSWSLTIRGKRRRIWTIAGVAGDAGAPASSRARCARRAASCRSWRFDAATARAARDLPRAPRDAGRARLLKP